MILIPKAIETKYIKETIEKLKTMSSHNWDFFTKSVTDDYGNIDGLKKLRYFFNASLSATQSSMEASMYMKQVLVSQIFQLTPDSDILDLFEPMKLSEYFAIHNAFIKLFEKQVQITDAELRKRKIFKDASKSFLLFEYITVLESRKNVMKDAQSIEIFEKYIKYHSRVPGILDESKTFKKLKINLKDDISEAEKQKMLIENMCDIEDCSNIYKISKTLFHIFHCFPGIILKKEPNQEIKSKDRNMYVEAVSVYLEKVHETLTTEYTEEPFVYHYINSLIRSIISILMRDSDFNHTKLYHLFCKIHLIVVQKLSEFDDPGFDLDKPSIEKDVKLRTIDCIWFEYKLNQSISIEEAKARLDQTVEDFKFDNQQADLSDLHMENIH